MPMMPDFMMMRLFVKAYSKFSCCLFAVRTFDSQIHTGIRWNRKNTAINILTGAGISSIVPIIRPINAPSKSSQISAIGSIFVNALIRNARFFGLPLHKICSSEPITSSMFLRSRPDDSILK